MCVVALWYFIVQRGLQCVCRIRHTKHANDHSPQKKPMTWYLYLLECRGSRLYAGIAKDPQARFQAHATGQGAKFTRAFPPIRLLGSSAYPDRSTASSAEYAIKRLPRDRKLAFLQGRRNAIDRDPSGRS